MLLNGGLEKSFQPPFSFENQIMQSAVIVSVDFFSALANHLTCAIKRACSKDKQTLIKKLRRKHDALLFRRSFY